MCLNHLSLRTIPLNNEKHEEHKYHTGQIPQCAWQKLIWMFMLFNDTVDGRNPKQPPGMYKNLKNGINDQPELVSWISEPSTVFLWQ